MFNKDCKMQIHEFYRSVIIEHYRNPRNQGLKPTQNNNFFLVEKENINCGDRIIVQVWFDHNIINHIYYEAQGCSILIASASIMSCFLKDLSAIRAQEKIKNFLALLKGESFDQTSLNDELKSFQSIQHFPGKFICASMPWHSLQQILIQENKLEK